MSRSLPGRWKRMRGIVAGKTGVELLAALGLSIPVQAMERDGMQRSSPHPFFSAAREA